MLAFFFQPKGKGHQETIWDNDEVTWDGKERKTHFQDIKAAPAALLPSSYPDC